jgi:hypothetical protein
MSLISPAKRHLSVLSGLLFAAIGFVPSAHAHEQCLVGSLNGPTVVNIAEFDNDGVGANLTKYAAVFHDIRIVSEQGDDPMVPFPCDTAPLRAAFAVRLQHQSDALGFTQFLDGGSVGFAYAAAALLAARNELTPPMDNLLSHMPYDPEAGIVGYCGHTAGLWTRANDCIDIFTVASEGMAWQAAYFGLSNRDTGQRQGAIAEINKSLLDFDNSLCIHDPTHPFDAAGSGPCNASISELQAALLANPKNDPTLETGATLLPLHHRMEDANYGIGLMSSIANAFLALDVSNRPVTSADYQNEQQFKDVMKALFRQGQRAAGLDPSSPDACDVAYSHQCFRPADPGSTSCVSPGVNVSDSMTMDDFSHRDQSCADQMQPAYRLSTYPVANFYEKYGFTHDANGLFEFRGDQFPFALFKSGDRVSALTDPFGFLGVARYEVYYVLTYQWLALPSTVPTFKAFSVPDCATLKKARAVVTGDASIRPGGSATITVTLDGAGPWTITWSDGEKDSNLINSPFTRTVSPTVNTTYSIVDIVGGECPGTASGSASITIAESRLIVDSVFASDGLPATYGATLLTASSTPIVNAELVFNLLGDEIGRVRTDANGHASIVHTVDVNPGTYSGAITVTYAGDATNPPASGSATLILDCGQGSFNIIPDAFNFNESGGTATVMVFTAANCPWTPVPNATWLHVNPATEGRGSGTFTITADPSSSGTRLGSVAIDSHPISVQQTVGCSFRFAPDGIWVSANVDPTVETTMNVAAPGGCSWTVTTDQDWILLDKASGTGNDTINFRVKRNDGPARTAHLSIASDGKVFTTFVNQYAMPPCTAPHLEIDATDGTVSNGSNIVITPLFSGTRLLYTTVINGFPVGESGIGYFFQARWESFYPAPGSSVRVRLVAQNECGADSTSEVTWTNVTMMGSTCLVPEFFFHPSSFNSPFPGASVELGVTATGPFGEGDPDLKYQWYQGLPSDRTSKVNNGDQPLVFVNPTTTTSYWVEISDTCGINISLPGTVFVTSRPRPRVASHDFTGDNQSDLVWHNEQTGQNELWSMFGTQHVGTIPLGTSAAHAELQSIGDLNEDNQPDLVFHDPTTGQSSVWLMNGTQLAAVQPLAPMPDTNWTIGAVADIDNDDNDDIVWHNGATGENQIWFQNGTQHTGTFALPPTPDANWGLHGAADFTHDGMPDLFFHNKATGENAIWIMNDAQPLTTSSLATNGAAVRKTTTVTRRNLRATVQSIESQPDTNWVPAQIVDLNGDGNPDIVWRNRVTGENSVWIMSGTTHTDTQALETRSDPAWQIGGGGSSNAGTPTTGTDPRTATTLHVTADPAPFDSATVIRATLTSASGPASGATIVFQLNGAEVARLITDDNGSVVAAASVAGIAAGAYSNAVSVHFTGDAQRAPSNASADLVVNGAQAMITWAYPADITYGQPLTAVQLNATANEAGSFAYSPAAGTVLNAGFHLLHVTFTPSDASHGSATKSVVLFVNKAGVTITWPSPAPIPFGTQLGVAQLNATASVPGTFTYNPSFGAIPGLGTQTLNVAFTPNDALDYDSASASTTINVIQGTQTIAWPAPQPITYGQPLTATQLNASVVTVGGAPGGALTYSPAAGTILPAGTQTLTVTAAATSVYTAASATRPILVLQATPVITWPNPAAIVYGTPLSAAQLNATSTVPGTFTYSPAAGTILSGGSGQTLSVTFTPSDSNHTSATKSVTIDVIKATPAITWAKPAGIVYGAALGATQLNATANVAGTFSYSPAAGTILNAGPAQTLSAQFTPTETNNYESAPAMTTIDVAKAQQTITWPSPAPIIYGTPLSTTQLNATAIGALTYTPPAGTILQAGVAQTLTVNAAATPNYEGATTSVTIDVIKATPVITWAKPVGIVYGTALTATQLNATANVAGSFVYTPAVGTQPNAGTQTLSTHFTPSDTNNYNDASSSVTIDVTKAKQTLSWTPPAAIVYGTPLTATQLNATAAVVGPSPAGALVYAPAAGTVLDAGARTLTVTAQETANYESATLSVSIQVNRAPLSLTVDAKSKLYGRALPALTGTLLGVLNGDAITPSYATTATQQSPAGTYPITGSLIDPNQRLSNYNVTITPSTLTVLPAPLQISANPATKQYSDRLPQLTATFTGLVLGETPSVLSGTLSITTTATPLSGPGSYPIAVAGLTSTNYAIVYLGSTLTVTQEDARVTITSPLLVSYSSASPTSITLSATVKDISATADAAGDVDAGDIRNSSLTFIDRNTHAVLCTATIDLVSPADPRIGVATCTFTRTFPTGTSSLVVGAKVGNDYTRDDASDDVTMTIAAPTVDSITGGGSTSGGAFNLNLQYDKSGAVKGSFTFKYQQDGRSYEISATNVDSLAIARSANGGTASIVGTATLRDVTKASDPIVIDQAARLVAIATDDGEPSTRDTLSVTLLKSNGGFWLATGWDGSRATAQSVTNGNIAVHYGH